MRSSRTRDTSRTLSLYEPNRAPCALDLSDNTNRWGVPPTAERVLRSVDAERVTRYPAVYTPELKRALAEYAGVRAEEIAVGCGSDDVLDSAIRAFAEPGDTLAYPDPTFGMLPLWAQMNGLVAAPVRLANSHTIDINALLATRARVTYVCSPNNPTGIAISQCGFRRLVEHAAGIVVLDEAYAEFASDGWIAEAPRHPRLIVTRTMSKAFGLAGLRIGYAGSRGRRRSHRSRKRAVRTWSAAPRNRSRSPHCATISNGCARTSPARRRVGALQARSSARRNSVLAIRGEFVLVPVPNADAVAAHMRAAGVAVRPFPRLCGIGEGVRITVAPWPMMDTALRALRSAMHS